MGAIPKHGHAQNGTSRVYDIWRNMRQRCRNPKASGYAQYGGRGISVCEEWEKFEEFLSWAIKNGYSETLKIERRDTDKNYNPENCYWANENIQQSNKRKRKNCASNYIGVVMLKGRWNARVTYEGKHNYLGSYDTQEEAAKVRDQFVKNNNLPHKLNF